MNHVILEVKVGLNHADVQHVNIFNVNYVIISVILSIIGHINHVGL